METCGKSSDWCDRGCLFETMTNVIENLFNGGRLENVKNWSFYTYTKTRMYSDFVQHQVPVTHTDPQCQ